MSSLGFWIVPLDQLDGANGSGSPKPYSPEQMQSWMSRDVSAIYASAMRGASAADIQQMRNSSNEREREISDAHRHLFDSGSGIKADYNPATDRLELSNGGSRVFWGRAAGATYAPVWVRAPDDRTLNNLRQAHGQMISDRHGIDLVEAHRNLTDRPDRRHEHDARISTPPERSEPQRQAADASNGEPERTISGGDSTPLIRPGRERKEIERERGFRFPEIER